MEKKVMSVDNIISKCEELNNDLSFNYVKQWKEVNKSYAIGFMPIYVPREIIHAAGMLPVGVMGGGENLEIIKGDAYFQSYICHIPRSTIEMAVSGRLDCMDGMLFPAICDVIRNLSGMWQMLLKGTYIKYMDLPQNFEKNVGGNFYKYEMETLKSDLENISGNKITDDSLRNSIKLYNENRKAIERLYAMRAEAPHVVKTAELYQLIKSSNIFEVQEHTALLNDYTERVIQLKDRPALDNVRVVVTGAFCEQPPYGLIKSIEQSGCYIVEDDWVLGSRFLKNDVKETGDPIEALSNSYLNDTVATASKYIGKEKKGEYLVQRIKELDAEGVVFCAPSFCDPALLERPMLADVLAKEDIPYTSFKYAENTGQFSVFKEQTGTFADSIKLWGGQ